jgi:hypothetical protein
MMGRVLREMVHRPRGGGGDGTAAATAGVGGAARALVISTYEADSGELLTRHKQRCAATKVPYKVRGTGTESS